MTTRMTLPLVLALGLLLTPALTNRAHAADGWYAGFRVIAAVPPRPIVEQVWIPGTWQVRTVTVLVAEARYEQRWNPPVYETRCNHWGRPYTVCVREGYYETVYVPARYETREERTWVPGHYETIAVPPPCPPVWRPLPPPPPVCTPPYRHYERGPGHGRDDHGPRRHDGDRGERRTSSNWGLDVSVRF